MLLKILIIIYSNAGTTLKIANMIKDEIGGDIFNVTSLVDYSGVSGFLKGCYHQIIGRIPDIKELPNIDGYDIIYVGSPTWAFKPAGPILNVLEHIDFQNKTVIPFLTCGGNYGSFFEKFSAAAKNANVVGQGAFRGADKMSDAKLKERVTNWLKQLPNFEENTEKQNEL